MRIRLATLSFVSSFALSQAAFAAIVTASPKSQPLGSVAVATSDVASLTLSSDTNNLPVTIVKDAANCTHGADMEVTKPSSFPANIPSNNPLPVDVTFTPLSRGTQSCQFDVMDDTGVTLLETFSLTGTGVAPVSAVSVPSLNYGGVDVGQSKDLSFTVGNSTTDAGQGLTINSITLTNSSQYLFVAKPSDLSVLQPGTQQTVTVRFKPTSLGSKQGYVNISTNDPTNPTRSVELGGTGLMRIINLPANALLDGVVAGASRSTTVAVGDAGNETLSVTGGALTASGDWITFADDPAGAGCPGSKTCTFDSILAIAPDGNTVNVAVQCTPPVGASGSQSETLTFASDTYPGTDKQTTVTCTVDDVIFADAFEGL